MLTNLSLTTQTILLLKQPHVNSNLHYGKVRCFVEKADIILKLFLLDQFISYKILTSKGI